MLRVGQNTDRREKRPQNRQAEWQEREALQASRPWALASLSLDSTPAFDRSKAGRIASQMWEANNLPWLLMIDGGRDSLALQLGNAFTFSVEEMDRCLPTMRVAVRGPTP